MTATIHEITAREPKRAATPAYESSLSLIPALTPAQVCEVYAVRAAYLTSLALDSAPGLPPS